MLTGRGEGRVMDRGGLRGETAVTVIDSGGAFVAQVRRVNFLGRVGWGGRVYYFISKLIQKKKCREGKDIQEW